MISFPKLGNFGRLGNQLFQYAYLRVNATRLQTQFYCPTWDGDAIFDLGDELERAKEPTGIVKYFDPAPEAGFSEKALSIEDHTEVQGFFQSERYYPNKQLVRSWYKFRQEFVAEAAGLYNGLVLRGVYQSVAADRCGLWQHEGVLPALPGILLPESIGDHRRKRSCPCLC